MTPTPREAGAEEAIGLTVAAAAVLLALGLAGTHGGRSATSSSCAVPAATGAYAHADAVPLFSLPDTGGFVLNGAPIAREGIEATLREVFAPRAEVDRVAFVWPPSRARCADLRFLEQATRAAGGPLFDAAASGWPRESGRTR